MQCPNCQSENLENANFCWNCGTTLALICPNCSTRNPVNARFCNHCGFSLSPAAAPHQAASTVVPPTLKTESALNLEGERRVMTILFCDVTGSTSMAEGMDPEEWTGIMNEAFQLLMEPVTHYEGTIARLMGDAILAFFGAPKGHEDDPQRAVLAGLEILENVQPLRASLRERYQIDFNVRVGINTGLAVVGRVGSDYKTEYTAMGDAVNIAARMEQTALPGTLQVAEDTYKDIASLFTFQPLGSIQVKGKKEPVQAYRVLQKKQGMVQARGITGLHSQLVGRDVELDHLKEITASLLEGRGQVVSLIGEAGLGKSRLMTELHDWVREQGLLSSNMEETQIGWYQGRSLSYQMNTPYAPFTNLFRKQFGLEDLPPDDPSPYLWVKKQVEQRCDDALQIAPFLATLMNEEVDGLDADRVKYLPPPKMQERIHQAVVTWMSCLAKQEKVILVFEDVHWMDAASSELLERLADLATHRSVLILALFRPNHQDLSWKIHQSLLEKHADFYTPLFLQPLDENQSRTLVANLLEIEDLPEQVRKLILAKAEGNPFFVEEVIRSLLDANLIIRKEDHWVATREIEQISIPDTLSGVISARLDRLDETARRLAQEAAVVGREFALPVLAAIYDDSLAQAASLDLPIQTLQDRELVKEKSAYPQRVLAFKHVLIQETAYTSLLHSRRRALHLRVAVYLEKSTPNQAEDIAHHFVEARESRRALPYLIQAGNLAARTYATTEAINFFNQVIAIPSLADNPVLAREAYEGLGRVLTFANQVPKAVETYQTMHAYGKEHDDIPAQVSALNKLSEIVAMRLGQFPEAENLLIDAEKMAREFGDKAGLAEMFMIRCGLCTAAGDFNGAVNYLDEFVQISELMDQASDVALGLAHIANTQIWMAEYKNGWETAQHSLKISREIGNRELQAMVLSQAIPLYLWHEGNVTEAYQNATEGAAIAVEIGASLPESIGAFISSRLAMEMGDYETALTYAQETIRAGQEYGLPCFPAMGLCILGSIYLEISPEWKAKITEAHQQAIQLIDLPGGLITAGLSWLELGLCALALGDEQRATEWFQKGLKHPNATNHPHAPLSPGRHGPRHPPARRPALRPGIYSAGVRLRS